MKKLSIFALLFISLSAFSQEIRKQIDLSNDQRVFLQAVKQINGFNDITIPDFLNKVTKNDVFLYFEYLGKENKFSFMPDNELRITSYDGSITTVHYLRFLNDKVFGYTVVDGLNHDIDVRVIRAPYPRIYDYTFKAVK